jgi:hypothetical protein
MTTSDGATSKKLHVSKWLSRHTHGNLNRCIEERNIDEIEWGGADGDVIFRGFIKRLDNERFEVRDLTKNHLYLFKATIYTKHSVSKILVNFYYRILRNDY